MSRDICFFHMSDLHLCAPFRHELFFDPEEKRQLQWEALRRGVETANRLGADYFFLTGDLFERETFTRGHAQRFFSILDGFRGSHILAIAGNHDAALEGRFFPAQAPAKFCIPERDGRRVGESLYRFDFPEDALTIWAHHWERQSYPEVFLPPRPSSDGRHILLMHTGLSDVYLPCSLREVAPLYNYIALGHVHKPMQILPNAAYAGSPEPLSIRETGLHGGVGGVIGSSLVLQYHPLCGSVYFDEVCDATGKVIEEICEDLEERARMAGDRVKVLRLRLEGKSGDTFSSSELKASLKGMFQSVAIVDMRSIDVPASSLRRGALCCASEVARLADGMEGDPIRRRALFDCVLSLIEEAAQ